MEELQKMLHPLYPTTCSHLSIPPSVCIHAHVPDTPELSSIPLS